MNKNILYYKRVDALAIWAADICSRAARQLICIEPTGLRLRHIIGKTDPQCGTVQFCFHSGRLTCSARTGFRAVTSPLVPPRRSFWSGNSSKKSPHRLLNAGLFSWNSRHAERSDFWTVWTWTPTRPELTTLPFKPLYRGCALCLRCFDAVGWAATA